MWFYNKQLWFFSFFLNSVIDLCQSITVTVWDKIVYFASYICLHLYVQFYICSTFPSFETRFDIVFFSFYKKKNNNPPQKKNTKKNAVIVIGTETSSFSFLIPNREQLPQCVICMKALENSSMKRLKLKQYLENCHPEFNDKHISSWKRRIWNEQRLDANETFQEQTAEIGKAP